jgi:ATP-dependent helicase/nuclease subunit B
MFLGALIDHCQSIGIPLIPPTMQTPSGIARQVLNLPHPHASELSRKIAWIEALQQCEPTRLDALIPNQPERDRWDLWLGLAAWLDSTSSELSDAGIRMEQVPTIASDKLEQSEQDRWATLGGIQNHYEQTLQSLSLVDDKLAAISCVQEHNINTSSEHLFVLLGVPQLGYIPRSCLSMPEVRVCSLVFAPESHEDRFDELGCVRTESWSSGNIQIDEERICFAENPKAMCEQTLAQLASRSQPLDTSSCVLGLADETILGTLRRTAALIGADNGVHIHEPSGTSARHTPVGQLIQLIHGYLHEPTYENLSSLVRHPHVEHALSCMYITQFPELSQPNAKWLKALDRLMQDHVPLSTNQLPSGVRDSVETEIRFVLNTTLEILEPLLQLPIESPPIDQWSTRLILTLEGIYSKCQLDPSKPSDRATISQLEQVQTIHEDLLSAQAIGQSLPQLSAHSALGVILSRLGEILIPEQPMSESIESVGWLELALDPSPVAVVLGMNDSSVPGSVTHDAILPSSLRETLGMRSNNDRFARDAYLISAIAQSRDATFMCARATQANEPNTPSRLLFQAEGQRLAARMRRFVEQSHDQPPTCALITEIQPGSTDDSTRPLRIGSDYLPPESMSVTEFDDYLRSPLTWYLNRSLRLREVETGAKELNAMQIGNLAHAVLDGFGKDESIRDLKDEGKIESALVHLLEENAKSTYGSSHPSAVKVQIDLLRYRLGLFARYQSIRAQQGWRITHTEWTPPEPSNPHLEHEDAPMPLVGKIDRIDIHPDGQIAVIDYKTGRISNPDKAHRKQEVWIKLQLPLYRHLVKDLVEDRTLQLGYGGLPSDDADPVWAFAQWNNEELSDADRVARQIVSEIRAFKPGDLIPVGDSPPSSGITGFISGERFKTGGVSYAGSDDESEAGGES